MSLVRTLVEPRGRPGPATPTWPFLNLFLGLGLGLAMAFQFFFPYFNWIRWKRSANQSSLSMYERAWAQPPECFEARTRYLALADKAARTVAVLTERLDQHRGRGQQQITVKHVTVNADQAVVTDQVVTGRPEGISSPAMLTAITEKPMLMITDETIKPEVVGGG